MGWRQKKVQLFAIGCSPEYWRADGAQLSSIEPGIPLTPCFSFGKGYFLPQPAHSPLLRHHSVERLICSLNGIIFVNSIHEMPVGVHTHRKRWHCLLSQLLNKIGMPNQRGPNCSSVIGILTQVFVTLPSCSVCTERDWGIPERSTALA